MYQSVPFAMPCTYCPSHPIVLWEGMDGLRFASCLFITTTSIHFIRALYRHGSNRTVENQIWLPLDSIHKHSGNPVSSAASTAVMEAYFPSPRKAQAMCRDLFAPGDDACSTKSPTKCIGSRNFDRLSINLSVWPAMIISTCFDKNTVKTHTVHTG